MIEIVGNPHYEFWVPGEPKPAGSKRGFYNKHMNRVQVVDASGKAGADWRGDVKAIVSAEFDQAPLEGPLFVTFDFYTRRPKSHFGTGRNAKIKKKSAPEFHVKTPDALKLTRAVEDALSGVLWLDDKQIVGELPIKRYGVAGVRIKVWDLTVTPDISIDLVAGDTSFGRLR